MPALLSLRINEYAEGASQPPHSHDALHLSLVLRGQLSETVGKHTVHATALSVVAKDPGVLHANRFDGTSVAVAQLSLRNLGIGALLDAPSRAFAWRWLHDSAVARAFLRVLRSEEGTPAQVRDDDPALLDLLACLSARTTSRPAGLPPKWLVDTLDRLQAEWRPSDRVSDVARTAGVHPVYLARCVRRWYGHGVQILLRQRRLAAATDLLSRKGMTVSEVATATGYADESHLCRETRTLLALAPGGLRSAIRQVAPIQGSGRHAQ